MCPWIHNAGVTGAGIRGSPSGGTALAARRRRCARTGCGSRSTACSSARQRRTLLDRGRRDQNGRGIQGGTGSRGNRATTPADAAGDRSPATEDGLAQRRRPYHARRVCLSVLTRGATTVRPPAVASSPVPNLHVKCRYSIRTFTPPLRVRMPARRRRGRPSTQSWRILRADARTPCPRWPPLPAASEWTDLSRYWPCQPEHGVTS